LATDNAAARSGPFTFTVAPGATVTYDIIFENTGTTIWRASEGYALKNLDSAGTPPVAGCDGLGPESRCTFQVAATTGPSPGTGSVRYRMHHGDTGFGDTITVTLVVLVVATPTPTATSTPTSTPTSTLTPTPRPAVQAVSAVAAAELSDTPEETRQRSSPLSGGAVPAVGFAALVAVLAGIGSMRAGR
jgi:hypothetical protein